MHCSLVSLTHTMYLSSKLHHIIHNIWSSHIFTWSSCRAPNLYWVYILVHSCFSTTKFDLGVALSLADNIATQLCCSGWIYLQIIVVIVDLTIFNEQVFQFLCIVHPMYSFDPPTIAHSNLANMPHVTFIASSVGPNVYVIINAQ